MQAGPGAGLVGQVPASLPLSGASLPLSGAPAPLDLGRSAAAPARRPLAQWLLEGRGWRWLRPALDLITLGGAVMLTLRGPHAHGLSSTQLVPFALLPLLVIALFAIRGMYRQRIRTLILDGIVPVVGSVSIAVMAVAVAEVYLASGSLDSSVFVRAWVLSLTAVGMGRIGGVLAQRWARSGLVTGRPALIVGAGLIGAHVARRLETHPEYGLRPVGFLDDDPPPSVEVEGRRAPLLGRPADLAQVVERTDARHVILAFSSSSDSSLIPLVRRCDELGLEVSVVPRLFESLNDRMMYETLGGLPVLGLRTVAPKGWQFAVKHSFDRLVAALVLVILAPALLALAAAVRLSSPGPVLFRQRRVGRDGTVFDLLKFRSMRLDSDRPAPFVPQPGAAPGGVEGDDRRTPIGRLLRRSSLDELPQLINVLRGEMSLVGPRPERPEFVELFSTDVPRYRDRHRVKSGITGWAQVHGLRGSTSLADRVEWDNYYIGHFSLGLDLKILALTLAALFRAAE
jgi:exopolysaccharide biosynthesis polyprenyl glycosylphosphotransferase